jgi:hypothetical protein
VQFKEDAVGRKYYEDANDVGGATNWSLLDDEGNKSYLELVNMLALRQIWFRQGEEKYEVF